MPETKKYYHNLDVDRNKVKNLLLNPLTTTQRLSVGGTLGLADQGYVTFDTTLNQQYFWNGTTWISSGGGGSWGSITGLITNQTDLINYLTSNYYPLVGNPSGFLTSVPDLQAVTNIGYTTTNPIEAQGGIWSVYNIYGLDNLGGAYVNSVFFGLGGTNELYALNPSATNLWALPDASGTIPLTVNGYSANSSGAITIPVGTGTVTGTGVATRVAFWDTSSSISSDADLYWDNINKRFGVRTASPSYPLDVNGEINTNVGIRIGTNGAQTGFYAGANIFDVWAGNNKIATWGLASPGGTLYDHFMSWVYTLGSVGNSNAFRIRSNVTSTSSNSAGLTQLLIDPLYTQLTFGSGTLRGIYYNPTIGSLNTSPHIAFENTTGDIIHGNLAGSGTRMVTADSAGKLSTTTFSANGLRSGIAAGTDTYTVTIAGVTSYVVNDTYIIQFTNANTGASTLNINGLGAVNLFKYNDVPVLSGDIGGGHQFIVSYDGTNFELIGIRPNQLFAFITNDDSVTINKGQPVYAFGAAGNRMSVKLANNTADATSAKTLGLVFSSSIAPNQTGFIIIQGVIENINTAAFSPGDTLYLGATAGALTNIKPYAPNHLVYLGIVERANAGNGQIYVRTQNGYELDELHDVDLITTPPTNNQVLAYETSSGLWKNKSLSALGAGTVTSVSASMVTPAQTVSVTNPTTTPAISIDDTNLLYNKFMVNQYSYMFPSDANTLWDTLRVGGTILSTGTVSALSETPMGQLFTTALAVGSVTGLFGTSFGGSGYLGTNFEFDFSYRFRINTNNGAQRLFCGVSSQYATATPTNVEPTTLINSIGVAKLQATANLYFVWNDATGTASSFDLGSGFLGTDTTSTYRMRIYKTSGIASINLELTKVTSGGTVTVTSLNIASDYNTGATMYPVIWMGNNTAVSGAVSFKNYGCQIIKRGLVNA